MPLIIDTLIIFIYKFCEKRKEEEIHNEEDRIETVCRKYVGLKQE